MIQRESKSKLKVIGYLVGVEIQEDIVTPEEVAEKLSDAVAWMEGTGTTDVEILGEIEIVEDGIIANIENMKES